MFKLHVEFEIFGVLVRVDYDGNDLSVGLTQAEPAKTPGSANMHDETLVELFGLETELEVDIVQTMFMDGRFYPILEAEKQACARLGGKHVAYVYVDAVPNEYYALSNEAMRKIEDLLGLK